jgi:GDPmannose 4,6-dehydratase
MGTLRLLEILRDLEKRPKFLNIGSSEIFGNPDECPQSELTPMRPVTPYGVAKAFAVNMTRVYREAFGMFTCNAICYNHESPRRGESFVTRKITLAAAAISLGLQKTIQLGSLDSRRDWGYAPEYVDAMWRMMQQSQPDDYVLATGVTHSVEEFLDAAFRHVGLDWRNHYRHDPRFDRPTAITRLIGDARKASKVLAWKATTGLNDLAGLMVRSDLSRLQPTPAVQ